MRKVRQATARALAAAFLDGPWTSAAGPATRGADAIDVTPRRLRATAVAVLAAYRSPPRDRPRELTAFILALPSYQRLWRRGRRPIVRRYATPATAMAPTRWHVAKLDTVGALADWSGVTPGQLDWYADVRSLERRVDPQLRHYDRDWVYNRRGAIRLLERPRPRLKALQRRLLREILDQIAPHDAAHGFVGGRSVRTYAAPHVGRDVVIMLDLDAFFPSIAAGRVFGVLRMAGYPEPVAHTLTGLATTVLPIADQSIAPQALRDEDIATRRRLVQRLSRPHLPQGAPTSPALANLVAFGLDARLAGLAAAADARYTRYADDLALSLTGPDAARRGRRLIDAVRAVISEEGFRVNETKTRLATSGQRQLLCGVVVNERPGVLRAERDTLRAILRNCEVHGPTSQNRDEQRDYRSHLLGRIGWVSSVNGTQGARLLAQFERIEW